MRACIQQEVDVIALPPVVEDGWDAVLTEAQDAGIPVIIVDRSVSADESLYASHIGSDMVLEGQKSADEMNKLTDADLNEEGANMLMLQTRQALGTTSLSLASQAAQNVLRLF